MITLTLFVGHGPNRGKVVSQGLTAFDASVLVSEIDLSQRLKATGYTIFAESDHHNIVHLVRCVPPTLSL